MTESGDQFAGTSERSTKHSPRVDEQLEHEIQGMLRANRTTRAEEWRDPEPGRRGRPRRRRRPGGHARRRHPGRHGRRRRRAPGPSWPAGSSAHDFPSTGAELVEAARDHRAPDAVVAELERLPAGETYERIGDVVRALGYPTET